MGKIIQWFTTLYIALFLFCSLIAASIGMTGATEGKSRVYTCGEFDRRIEYVFPVVFVCDFSHWMFEKFK